MNRRTTAYPTQKAGGRRGASLCCTYSGLWKVLSAGYHGIWPTSPRFLNQTAHSFNVWRQEPMAYEIALLSSFIVWCVASALGRGR